MGIQMFSPKNLQLGICLASAMVLSSIPNAATKNVPTRLAQMTPGVCWATCSAPCGQTYEKCTAEAKPNPDQLAKCQTVSDACYDRCRDQCGLKK
jgi:hypothetical protein